MDNKEDPEGYSAPIRTLDGQTRMTVDLRQALRSIALALNVCNGTVTTDRPDAEPDTTSWRINNTREIALLHQLERLLLPNTDTSPDCPHCDTPGGKKTFENQVCMPINGRVQCIDHCIHQIVAALNAGGVTTIASCCGHGRMPGRIDLQDGRVLVITRDADQLVWQDLEQ